MCNVHIINSAVTGLKLLLLKNKHILVSKCLQCIFPPLSFLLCLSLPPSLALIDHWHNSGDVCFIKCLNVFLILLAKQWIWRKNPAVLLPLERRYSHLQEWKKLFLLDWSEEKPALFLSAHWNCWSFPCWFSKRVIYQKQAETKAATEAWECVCDVLVCFWVWAVSLSEWVRFITNYRWYLLSRLSAADISINVLPSGAHLAFMIKKNNPEECHILCRSATCYTSSNRLFSFCAS